MNRYFKKYFNDKLIFLLIFLFITSRILYYYLGIRFEFFQSYWQILPLDLLKNDLLKTLFFNFSQPPLLNFLLGVGLKIGNHILFLHLFFMIMGLIAFINFYKILLYFTSCKFSFFLTLILMIMPLTILWENHGYKDYLTMCFLINCIFYSLKIIDKNYYKQYFFLSINLILISILRETFHYFWVLIFILFEFLLNKRLKKTIFLFLITAFFILPFYIKNLIIFNKFQIAGWMYENLTQKTLYIQQMKNGEHLLLKKFCKKFGMTYSCTAFDLKSLVFLVNKLNIPFIKIASGEITSIDLLEYAARQEKMILLSTGMATYEDIKNALTLVKSLSNKKLFAFKNQSTLGTNIGALPIF
jgi:hypothetical protein